MLVRSGFVVAGLILLSLGRPAQAGEHDTSPARASTVARQAGKSSLEALSRLNEMIELFDEMKKNGTPFANATLEQSVRLLAKRFMEAEDADAILPGTTMLPADQTVFFDNIQILYEYATEVMALQASDNLTTPLEIEKLAASNLEKKWRVLGRQRRKNWSITDADDSLLGAFGLREAIRREKLVSTGNVVAFRIFVADLNMSLTGQFGPGEPEPARPSAPAASKSIFELAKEIKGKDGDVKKVGQDYESLRQEYQLWMDANIKGKDPKQLGEDVLNEARRRSLELRQLEATLDKAVGELPQELKDAMERFKKDPRHFVETEYESFLVELRTRDPRKADDLERLVTDYKDHSKRLQVQLQRFKGKTPEQIGDEGLKELRKESAAVRQFEGDLRSVVTQIEEQKKKLEKEFKEKSGSIKNRLDGQLQDFKQNDLKRIEGDLKSKIEGSKDQLEKDLKDLGRIFGK